MEKVFYKPWLERVGLSCCCRYVKRVDPVLDYVTMYSCKPWQISYAGVHWGSSFNGTLIKLNSSSAQSTPAVCYLRVYLMSRLSNPSLAGVVNLIVHVTVPLPLDRPWAAVLMVWWWLVRDWMNYRRLNRDMVTWRMTRTGRSTGNDMRWSKKMMILAKRRLFRGSLILLLWWSIITSTGFVLHCPPSIMLHSLAALILIRAVDNHCLFATVYRPLPSWFLVSLNFHWPQKSMREGGSLFIIHYPEATLTSMFQIIEICAQCLTLPWFWQKSTLFHEDCQCNTVCWFLN